MLCYNRKLSNPSLIERRARRGSETCRTKGGSKIDYKVFDTWHLSTMTGLNAKSPDKQLAHAVLNSMFNSLRLERPAPTKIV